MSEKDEQNHRPGSDSPSPTDMRDPILRLEVRKAGIWFGMATGLLLIALLAHPILLIFGAIVLATMLDGGARLLNRILPVWRGLRLTIVILLVFGFVGWTIFFAGTQFTIQITTLQTTVASQIDKIGDWAAQVGLTATPENLKELARQAIGSVGEVTRAVTTVFGVLTSVVLMIVLGVFIAAEPRLYERGMAWMLPSDKREYFYTTFAEMGWTLRRLMAGRLIGMGIEGLGTWLLLSLGGVPMAGLLGILTGLLAFVPNIGAIVSGVLIISVGFSAGVDTGIFAFFVYMGVQLVDGYIIVPMVAKRAVDLAPALVLSAQILLGTLFGILGLALADPIVAMIKVFLERRSKHKALAGTVRIEGH